jgi:hypothetical protein
MKGLENVGSDTHTTFPKVKCQRHIQLLNMHRLPASHILKVLPLRFKTCAISIAVASKVNYPLLHRPDDMSRGAGKT